MYNIKTILTILSSLAGPGSRTVTRTGPGGFGAAVAYCRPPAVRPGRSLSVRGPPAPAGDRPRLNSPSLSAGAAAAAGLGWKIYQDLPQGSSGAADGVR